MQNKSVVVDRHGNVRRNKRRRAKRRRFKETDEMRQRKLDKQFSDAKEGNPRSHKGTKGYEVLGVIVGARIMKAGGKIQKFKYDKEFIYQSPVGRGANPQTAHLNRQ